MTRKRMGVRWQRCSMPMPREGQQALSAHIEILAAAYLAHTDIPPDEACIVWRTDPAKMTWRIWIERRESKEGDK
jgi:hypothetical protein